MHLLIISMCGGKKHGLDTDRETLSHSVADRRQRLFRRRRIADVGDVVELEGARLEVLEMDRRRITKVLFEYMATTNTDLDVEVLPAEQSPETFVHRATKRILKGEKVVRLAHDDQGEKADSTSEKAVPDLEHKTGA